MNVEENPFVSNGYYGPSYFCDRKEETKLLTGFFNSGINVTLFSIRRIGKTGLIQHVFHQFERSKKIRCIYLDILATQNLSDFTNQLATAVYDKFPVQRSMKDKLLVFLQKFRPTLSFDELTGSPLVSLAFDSRSKEETTIAQIFKFLDQQKVRVVFCIDEFQQILEYPQKNTEALLRSHMNELKNCSFVFCGSNQKMMHEIFNSAKRPFFASCTNITLDYITKEEYKKFIKQQFSRFKRKLDEECLDFICDWTKLHTFYTQHFCHTLFAKKLKQTKLEDAKLTASAILKLNESIYFQYRNLLTSAQWNLLHAIAKEEILYKPQSTAFISKYKLGTPATVKRSLDALIKKELIYHNTSTSKHYYEVYDKFFMRWLQYL